MMSLEFEIPMVSMILILLLFFIYILKPKVKLIENKYYLIILIFSLIETTLGFIAHLLCAIKGFDYVVANYYTFFNILNKFIGLSFIGIFCYMLVYILAISYKDFKKKVKMIKITSIIFLLSCFVLLCFTNIELVEVGNVTNVRGPTIMISYAVVAVLLLLNLIITLCNAKKIDKRYIALFVILPLMIVSYYVTLAVPGIIIYDFILVLLCYIMYFTIENPDMKMVEQLNIAKDQAEKANNAKTDFLSSMSHEIRTPLNAIVGFSHGLLEENLSEEATSDVKNIIMASDSLLELVNGILDISKIEANKLEIINTSYNFDKIFKELVLLTKARIGEKSLDFRYSYDNSIPQYLYGDSQRVKQIILNLLTNSVKYTKEGFVDFKINSVIKGDIIRLIISVEDSGIGIKQENIEKLFTKFERLEVERNTTTEGTGLGLAITKKLVEMMGGQIVVQSVYGTGSKFTVSIDQKIVSAAELEKIRKTTPVIEIVDTADVSGKKVLIVDDNTLNIKVAERLLKQYNLTLDSSTSGQDCIDKINSGENYDLILLDDMMPKMSGTETLKNLKSNKEFKIPVVALTANAIAGMKEKYLSDGFDDYLSKPIEKLELDRVIKKYLNNK